MTRPLDSASPDNGSPTWTKVLFSHIQQNSELADRIITLLHEEAELLKQRKPQELESLLLDKNQFLAELATSARQRRQWLEQLGADANESNWMALLQENGGQKLLQNWHDFNERLQQCHHLNNINGKMIARGRQTINRLLDIARGQTDTPRLYTSNGRTQINKASHGLVKA